jgi:histone H3
VLIPLLHDHPLRPFTTNASGQLNVLGHDGNTLGVNGAQVCILKHTNKVSLQSLLEGKYSCASETQVTAEILSNLLYQTLEWRLANQKVSRLLVFPDLSKLS